MKIITLDQIYLIWEKTKHIHHNIQFGYFSDSFKYRGFIIY
jgi:hypothetical protein